MDRTAIEFHLLGTVEATTGGTPLGLGGPRQRALLALLLLEPGRPVSTARLADELWHGAPPPGAETTLRSYVSRLRRVLGGDAIAAQAGGYALAAEPDRVDAQRFERLVQQGRGVTAGLATERLAAALALWRGPALAGVCDAGALAREAQRLDELRLICLEERIEADLELGRHAQLVPELRALVHEHPLRERLWRQLVLALYRSGRQADALAAYRDARALLDRELGLEPSEELRELEGAILRQELAPVAAPAARNNLPAAATSFVGRERELDELAALLRAQRLVTVTGMGGAGKTRLAVEVARGQVDVWADGVWLVDLTALSAPELVADAVAAAVSADEPLLDHLRGGEALIVLDNCEHLAAACAELAAALLARCAGVRILATSRVSLNVQGEHDYPLDPLEPGTAVRLFLERATAVRRDVRDEPAIAEICRELDGLPLAIELAAARAKALSPTEIAARLDDRLRFLRAWRRVADPRHRTLETTMDWSYDLLAPEEQELLRRLSVFAGGATLDAVDAVCAGGDEAQALDLLGRLVDASLVRVEPGEPTRYLLLETVRQYAAAKFDEEEVRRLHAEHYLAVADAANLSIESLGRGVQRQEVVLREQHNLRAALDWAADADVEIALRLAVALENFWVTQAPVEGVRRYEQLLVGAGALPAELRARATRDLAACLDVLGRIDDARPTYARSRELFAEAGNEVGVAHLDFRLGIVASMTGDLEQARTLWHRSLEVFERHDDTIGKVQALGGLGALELDAGDPVRGRALVDEARELAHGAGWLWWEARTNGDLAARLAAWGEPAEAEQLARRFLEFAVRTANRQETLYGLAILARAAAARGEDERALALWASVQAVEDGPGRFGHFDRAAYAAAMPREELPEPLPLEDAVALALA